LSLDAYDWLRNVSHANTVFGIAVMEFDDLWREKTIPNNTYTVKNSDDWPKEDEELLERYKSEGKSWRNIGELMGRSWLACKSKHFRIRGCVP
jgi:hypothetical protein